MIKARPGSPPVMSASGRSSSTFVSRIAAFARAMVPAVASRTTPRIANAVPSRTSLTRITSNQLKPRRWATTISLPVPGRDRESDRPLEALAQAGFMGRRCSMPERCHLSGLRAFWDLHHAPGDSPWSRTRGAPSLWDDRQDATMHHAEGWMPGVMFCREAGFSWARRARILRGSH